MCGFAGVLTGRPASSLALRETVDRMAEAVAHRGPNDAGVWVDEACGLALGHRRLSVIDLSSAGHQPMTSPCGRFILVYNGEIYNHQDLRRELRSVGGHFDWDGHSDTETLLAMLCHWGVEGALKRLNGMFAFALWDQAERSLYLARDRMGEKPLYYGRSGGTFLFGSETKALKKHPDWQDDVDRDALRLYLRYNYIPAPWSIFCGIRKLLPAHYVVVRERGSKISEPRCYWNLGQIAEAGVTDAQSDDVALTDELDTLLRDSISRRMISDVPLGAFVSGGIDSSTVVAIMQSQSARPVKTFTIGFHEARFNEAEHAKAVATHLGTDHTEVYVGPKEVLAIVPRLPAIWDEPFSDSSQIPTLMVSELARQHVTVSLSGDGGDELFCGYNRYNQGYRVWRKLALFPRPLRQLFARFLCALPGPSLDALIGLLPKRFQVPRLSDRLPKLADVVTADTPESYYHRLVSQWTDPADVVRRGREPPMLCGPWEGLPHLLGVRERMMYLDSLSYFPDDILTKVDRASMAVSLEARVPLLDHRVVEFAWRVPIELKYRDGKGKWILRQVLERYVPNRLTERPKMGFGVPIEHWLRGPLRDWSEALLDEKRLRKEGFFDPAPIRQKWREHISGRRSWQYHLWNVLMFQAWLEESS